MSPDRTAARAARTNLPLERGVWGILATPFTPDGEVDLGSLTAQVELFARVGARGVVALGVFGEAAKLSTPERHEVARTALRVAAGHGLGVVVGITTLATAPTIEQARDAVALAQEVSGAEGGSGLLRGVMVQVPTADEEGLARHLDAVHAASGAGLVVQDYPASSSVRIGAAALARVVARTRGVVAVKAESTPTVPAVAALTAGCSAPVFGGLGGVALIDELGAGAAGAMTGFSFPEGLVATVTAFDRGGFDEARSAWATYLPLAVFEQQDGIALAIRKEALRRRGVLAHATVRQPGPTLPESLLEPLARHLAALA
jgi:4-hydroxy-tetrahydrodipicolinate synthase